MKLSIHFMDCVGHHGDHATHLQRLTTHLVYFLLSFHAFYSIFTRPTFVVLNLQVTTTKAPIASLNIRISGEGEEAAYVDVPLVPKLECPKLPFPPTFIGASVLLTLFAIR